MKVNVLFVVLYMSLVFNVNNTTAQQFINGGFEPKITLSACNDMDVKAYNHNMSNNWSAGDATTMQIANNTCSQGSPVSGSYFGVLKYMPPSDGNIIVFRLDKPMMANKAYSFSLSYKLPTGSSSSVMGGLRYGYSSDSLNVDSTSGTTDPITNTSWKKDTITITPKQSWQYIWIQVAAVGGDPFTVHVDDLTMLNTGTSIKELPSAGVIRLVPNPFVDNAVLTIDDNVKLPYSIVVYDISGKQVVKKNDIRTGNFVINRESFNTGLYTIKVIDNEQHIYTSKFNVQ